MKNVAEEAEMSYSRLFRLHLQVTQAQPSAPTDLLRLLNQVINTTSARLPALERSIQAVKTQKV